MRNLVKIALALGVLTLVARAADDKNSVVITFKDGHQQSFPLSEVSKIQFKTPSKTTSVPLPISSSGSAGHFMGRWRCGDGQGRNFIITLDRDGHATKSIGSAHGTWTVENGTLPPGLSLSTDGVVKGVPAALGSYEFTVRATSGLRSWFAPGTISVRGDVVDVSSIVAALLGGPALSPTQVQLLDQIGNKNGILDTGDLRAYLRSQSRLP